MFVTLFLSAFLAFSLSGSVLAEQDEAPKDQISINKYTSFGSLSYEDANQKVFTLTDRESLDQLIADEEIEVPDGYQLTSINTTVLYTEPAINYNTNRIVDNPGDSIVTPMTSFIVKWISNVRTIGDRYYADQPLYSDWFEGPLPDGFTYTLKNVVNSGYSSKFGFSAKEVSAEVGFNASTGHEISRNFRTESVASNKKLNVKIFTNYSVRQFDENRYLQSGGVKGPTSTESGSAWRPVGYIVQQQQYTK